MSPEARPPDITALEAALAQLAPNPERFNRDRVMFQAGQQSLARNRNGWRWATAVMTLVAVTLGVTHLGRPAPPTEVRIVYVPAPAEAPVVPANTEDDPPPQRPGGNLVAQRGPGKPAMDYLERRQLVLRWGVEELPRPAAVPPPPRPPAVKRDGAPPPPKSAWPTAPHWFKSWLPLGDRS
jgi:hypothetical protein